MDQEKNLTPAPHEHNKHTDFDVEKNDSSSQDKDYMFDKMNTVEEAGYDPNENGAEHKEHPIQRSLYQKYRKFIL